MLEESIQQAEERIKRMDYSFYNRSLTTRNHYYDDQLTVKAFNIELEVCDHVTVIQNMEKHIEDDKKKQRYFLQYLDSISSIERHYFKKRYVFHENVECQKRIEEALMEEISEIEEALQRMNGLTPDLRESIRDGTVLGFEDMLELLEV